MTTIDTCQDAATDAEQARRWAGGDERSFEALVVRYAPMVHARCRRSLGSADADDATQAVFLVLHARRAQAAASPALAAWLLVVAGNVVRNAVRDRRRRVAAEEQAPVPATAEEQPMDDLREHLDRCLAELPTAEREAVQLYHLAGHTLAEIAAHTRTPVQTIHARVQRGLHKLRDLLVRRGVAITVAALVAGLHAEADAAAPVAVIERAMSIPAPPAGGVTSAQPAHIHRWSHHGWSPMTTASLAGVAALLVGSFTLHLLPGSEPATSPAVPGQASTEPPLVHRGPPRGPVVVSINPDGSTTMIRMSDLPLPPGAAGVPGTAAGRLTGTIATIDGRTFLVGRTPDGTEVRIPMPGADGMTIDAAGKPLVRGQVEIIDGQPMATWTDAQGRRQQQAVARRRGVVICKCPDGDVTVDTRAGYLDPAVLDRLAQAHDGHHPLGDLASVPGRPWDGTLADETQLDASARADLSALRARGGAALLHAAPDGAYRLHWIEESAANGVITYQVRILASDGVGHAASTTIPVGAG